MYCYNVVDDCIVLRKIRKKCLTDEQLKEQLLLKVPAAKIFCIAETFAVSDGDIYDMCKSLVDICEDLSAYDWFISVDYQNILAYAIMAVVENKHLWKIMQDKDTLYAWMKTNVR